MATPSELDLRALRALAPEQRHGLVFQTFEALAFIRIARKAAP